MKEKKTATQALLILLRLAFYGALFAVGVLLVAASWLLNAFFLVTGAVLRILAAALEPPRVPRYDEPYNHPWDTY